MIILSSAMGKSGSTFFCNLQEDMLALSGVRSGQSQLRKFLGGRFVEHFHAHTVINLLFINQFFGSIIVKTHTPPTRFIKWLIKHQIAKATYNYRDVRDVILSALDQGARNRKNGKTSGLFANLFTVEDALNVGVDSVKEMQKWVDFGDVQFIRYENLINNRLNELKMFADLMSWQIPENTLQELIQKHENKKTLTHNFNKGTTQRYIIEMTRMEQQVCKDTFHDYLVNLDYEKS